jgi:hypothetical protein
MAFTLYPFIVRTPDETMNYPLMNHEKIHLAQAKELWVLPFYLLYFLESFVLLIRYLNANRAYLMNRFELEAGAYCNDFTYLSNRVKYQPFKESTPEIITYKQLILDKYTHPITRIASVIMILLIFLVTSLIIYGCFI